MLSAYLRELDRELSRRLPPEDVRSRLVEIEAHLGETLEAYREMKLEEEAAIGTMGCPRRLARDLERVATDRPHRGRMAGAAVALLAFGALVGVCAYLDSKTLVVVAVALLALGFVGVAVGAFRARRAALVPHLAMAIALVFPLALFRSSLCFELPIPGTARPERGLSVARLVYRPYGTDRNLLGLMTERGDRVLVADMLPNVDPFAARLSHNLSWAAVNAASALVVLGGVDLAFAGLGSASLVRRRRRGVA